MEFQPATVNRTEVDGVTTFWIDEKRPTLTARLAFRAGSMDEPLVRAGWLHLLEHAALHGPIRQGLEINGEIGWLTTAFDVASEPDEVVAHLARLTGRLRTVPVDDLAHEREVLRAESNHGGPGMLTEGLVWRYGSRGPAVTHFDGFGLDAATPESLQELAAQFFTAGNAVLCLSGPPPAGLRLDLPTGTLRPTGPPPPAFIDRGVYYSDLPAIMLHGVVPRGPAAAVLSQVLQDRVTTALRHEKGTSYAPHCDIEAVSTDRTVMYVAADVATRVPEAVSAILDTVATLASAGASEQELRDIQRAAVRDIVDPSTAMALTWSAGRALLLGEEIPTGDSLIAELRGVTSADVAQVAGHLVDTTLLGIPPEVDLSQIPLPALKATDDSLAPSDPAALVFKGKRGGPVATLTSDCLHMRHAGDGLTTPWERFAGMAAHVDGSRLLIRDDGTSWALNPDDFRKGADLIAAIDARFPASRVVPWTQDAETDEAQAAARDELAQARADLKSDAPSLVFWVLATVVFFVTGWQWKTNRDLVSTPIMLGVMALLAAAFGIATLRSFLAQRRSGPPTDEPS